ncbi:hypothetical protein [Pseudanabaena sp. ABRG5-3]|uniref:hypothetical protein n=1 Tax=Pseudanabaena sp. ABRG5-3 TaxID=685565 RepID=UPI000F836F95|nr:hypothetical protein [Pseudanabaena sp. ABRG5-3]
MRIFSSTSLIFNSCDRIFGDEFRDRSFIYKAQFAIAIFGDEFSDTMYGDIVALWLSSRR